MTNPNIKTEFLRHTLATLAYRGGKAIRGAPRGFAELRIAQSNRPLDFLYSHILPAAHD